MDAVKDSWIVARSAPTAAREEEAKSFVPEEKAAWHDRKLVAS